MPKELKVIRHQLELAFAYTDFKLQSKTKTKLMPHHQHRASRVRAVPLADADSPIPMPNPIPPPVPVIPLPTSVDSATADLQALVASRQSRHAANAAAHRARSIPNPSDDRRAKVRELYAHHAECKQHYDDCVTIETHRQRGHGQAENVYWEQMRARQDRMDAFLASELGRSYATLIRHVVDELFCGWGRRR